MHKNATSRGVVHTGVTSKGADPRFGGFFDIETVNRVNAKVTKILASIVGDRRRGFLTGGFTGDLTSVMSDTSDRRKKKVLFLGGKRAVRRNRKFNLETRLFFKGLSKEKDNIFEGTTILYSALYDKPNSQLQPNVYNITQPNDQSKTKINADQPF